MSLVYLSTHLLTTNHAYTACINMNNVAYSPPTSVSLREYTDVKNITSVLERKITAN